MFAEAFPFLFIKTEVVADHPLGDAREAGPCGDDIRSQLQIGASWAKRKASGEK